MKYGRVGTAPAGTRSVVRAVRPAPAASAGDVGTTETVSVHPPAAGMTVVNNFTVHVTNAGVLGSERDVQSWFVSTMDTLSRQRRLPGS
jgi:hypothetical protein